MVTTAPTMARWLALGPWPRQHGLGAAGAGGLGARQSCACLSAHRATLADLTGEGALRDRLPSWPPHPKPLQLPYGLSLLLRLMCSSPGGLVGGKGTGHCSWALAKGHLV